MPLWRVCIILTERAEIAVLQSWIMFERSMYQKSIPFPCSQVACLLNPSKASPLRFPESKFCSGMGSSPHALLPTCRTRVSLFLWFITFDLSGLGDRASSYPTAGLALRIIWPHKPHHYVKVGTPSGGLRETDIENHFIWLGNQDIYCIFKTCCPFSILFSTKCCLFHNCIFYIQIHFSSHFKNQSYTTCNMF